MLPLKMERRLLKCLPRAAPLQARHVKTLVLDLDDVLVHSDWSRERCAALRRSPPLRGAGQAGDGAWAGPGCGGTDGREKGRVGVQSSGAEARQLQWTSVLWSCVLRRAQGLAHVQAAGR